MIMAVHITIVLIVTILGSEDGGAERTCKMVNMVLAIKRRDIRSTKSTATLVTEEP